MKWIKTFEQVSKELSGGKLDKVTSDYCSGIITESEFINYLDEVINEGLGDWLKSVKQKIVDMFYTFVLKAYQIGLAIYDKVSQFIKWLTEKISSWREKHPTAWKVIIITIIIIVIFIVTASSAKAATTGTPIPTVKIDMAIGWLDNLKSGGEGGDPMILNKAIAHLMDLRDGHVDIPNLGSEAVNMANAALRTVDQITSSSSEGDPQFYQFCVGLIERGRDYVEAIYTQGGGIEKIKLVTN